MSEIVWDIVDVAWEQVYHNWVQNEIFPYAVEDARQKLLQSIAVRSNAHSVCNTEELTSQPPTQTDRSTYTHSHHTGTDTLSCSYTTCTQEHKTIVCVCVRAYVCACVYNVINK